MQWAKLCIHLTDDTLILELRDCEGKLHVFAAAGTIPVQLQQSLRLHAIHDK